MTTVFMHINMVDLQNLAKNKNFKTSICSWPR